VSEAGTPPPSPQDASVNIVQEAGIVDAGKEAGPLNPCWGGLVGPARAFCEKDLPTMVSVEPMAPDAKKKLYLAMSAATTQAKLVVRHSNGSSVLRYKTVVLLENTGKSSGSFILLKKGVAGPTTDLTEGESLAVGRWASSTAAKTVPVAAGKSVRFDPSLEVGLQKGYATMGLYEYSFDQPHTVHVCFVGSQEDPSVCPSL
jgi:hypothetical protein